MTITSALHLWNKNESKISMASHGLVSADFKARFEWLSAPSSSSKFCLSEAGRRAKEDAICATLRGNDREVVDLWKLRELALSPGGLLCPALRRRAWPTLVGCHEQVLEVTTTAAAAGGGFDDIHRKLVTPSASDTQALERGVGKTVWAVEDCLIASREEQRLQERRMRRYLEIQRQRQQHSATKRVTFDIPTDDSTAEALGVHATTMSSGALDLQPPATIAAVSPTSQGEVDEESLLSNEDHSRDHEHRQTEEAPPSHYQSEGDDGTHSTSITLSSRVIPWRKTTAAERKVLYNCILSVLRTEAPASDYFEDDGYHVSIAHPVLCLCASVHRRFLTAHVRCSSFPLCSPCSTTQDYKTSPRC